MALTPKEVGDWAWRDHDDPNTPIPGTEHKPLKSEIRDYVAAVDVQDAATLDVANAAMAGVTPSTQTIRVRSTGNVDIATALQNGDTLNGVVLATGNHVFLGFQTDPAENGIYTVVAAGAAVRATFADSAAELSRVSFLMMEGTVGAGEVWMLPLATASITLGTTALVFAQIRVEIDYAANFTPRLEAVELPLRVFRPTVTDALLLAVVLEAQVWGAFDFEDFYLNREFYDYGAPYNKWAKLNLHGPSGDVVAAFSRTDINPGSAPEWIFLTNVVNGAVQPGYEGIVCALRMDWSAVAAFGWNDLLAGFTGSATASGLRRELNHPASELDKFAGRVEPYSTTVAGTGGSEATVQAAVDALLLDDGSTISRSTFPNSDLSTPATPRRIQVINGAHDETITPQTILGVETGLILPHWSELILPPTAILRMASGGAAPVLEANQASIVRGGKTINSGDGYCFHADGQDLVRRGAAPVVLRYRHVLLIEDHTFEPHGTGSSSAGIGGGAANGLHVVIRRCVFTRGAGIAPHVVFHTVPNTTDPALFEFENCWFDSAFTAVEFLKSHETDVRHVVSFKNCEGGAIDCSISGGIGGGHAFVRAGAITGFTSVSANLDPA